MSNFVIAYDADCGPCTRFKQIVDIMDRYHRIDFLSLIEAEKLGLLEGIPQSLRFASFHLISPTGNVWSGADALPALVDIFPCGSFFSRLIMAVPAGKRMTRFVYQELSRLRDSGSCKKPR